MVCSGDTDGRVPFTSTQYAINKMKLPIKTEWYPWFHGGEVNFFFFFFLSLQHLLNYIISSKRVSKQWKNRLVGMYKYTKGT
jgi:hypothetical protein